MSPYRTAHLNLRKKDVFSFKTLYIQLRRKFKRRCLVIYHGRWKQRFRRCLGCREPFDTTKRAYFLVHVIFNCSCPPLAKKGLSLSEALDAINLEKISSYHDHIIIQNNVPNIMLLK